MQRKNDRRRPNRLRNTEEQPAVPRDGDEMTARQRLEQRRIRQRQTVDIPGIGPVEAATLTTVALVGGGLWWLSKSDDGGPILGSAGNGLDASAYDDRTEWMSACLEATGGDMSACSKRWKAR